MRCLFCGKALLFRRGGEQFCGAAHREQYNQMVVTRLEPARAPARRKPPEPPAAPAPVETPAPSEPAGFRCDTLQAVPPDAGPGRGVHPRRWELAAPWGLPIPEQHPAACRMASVAPVSLQVGSDALHAASPLRELSFVFPMRVPSHEPRTAAGVSLAARKVRAVRPPDPRPECAGLARATGWRRAGIPTARPRLSGCHAPRRALTAGPVSLRLDGQSIAWRLPRRCEWRGHLRRMLPRVAARQTTRFSPHLAPTREIRIAPICGALPAVRSSRQRRYARFVVPRVPRKPVELPVLPLVVVEAPPKVRWSPRRAWILAPRLVRAAVLLAPLLGAGWVVFPRIEAAVSHIRWERPAVVVGWQRQIESRLRARAAIEIEDNFTSGLSGWDGGPGGLSDWVYDQAGLIQPGKLAILKASRPLSNYRFEFVGQIRKKGMSWAFRAADHNNYYAMKIVVTQPGPLPRTALVRYAVVRGIPDRRVQVPLPPTLGNGTVYLVVTRVYNDGFITSVNGQVVDSFIDRRHPAGGVGLFRASGEEARIVRVRVADRDDLIGKLCAYFCRLSADSWSGPARRAP